jgi:hypothetical protein
MVSRRFAASLARAGALLTLLGAPRAAADPLTGGTAAAVSTAEAADANPANAAFIDRTQFMIAPEIFKQESLQIRYPGFETISQNESGMGSILSFGKPSFIFKLTPRLGIGGYVVPPLGLGTEIKKDKIPIVVLDTLNYVDLAGKGTLDGAGQLVVGYRFTDRFGFGMKASFQSVTFDATLTPSEGGDPLVTIHGEQTSLDVTTGLRYDAVPGRFAVGTAFGLINSSKNKMDVESSLMSATGEGDEGGGGGEGGQGGTAATVANPLNSFLVGIQAGLGSKIRLLADAKYTRANKSEVAFSLVDLKEKPKDVHDTLGARFGAILGITSGANGLVGFRYEPASLGAGSRGDDGLVGFGTTELVQVFAGLGDMTPFWEAALGMQWGFSPKAGEREGGEREGRRGRGEKGEKGEKGERERGDRGRRPPQGYYEWTVSLGVAYRRASLGIDENGELPGAYLYKKTFIPLTVVYKL